jgi:TPR repeat protein
LGDIEIDYKKAMEYYLESGTNEALNNIGLLYLKGLGIIYQ